MRILNPAAHAAICALAALATSACSEDGQQGRTLLPASTSLIAAAQGSVAQAGHSGSWMAPGAAKHDLLYVANDDDVTVYTYPEGKLVGTLRDHFFDAAAECSDKAGDVFITDGLKGTIYEYAHAAKKPLRTLTYSALATGCSADPTTGNLAVTYEVSSSTSYVAIYKNAQGTPTLYQDGNLSFTRCGYDPHGNLYAGGVYNSYRDNGFVELRKGGNSLTKVTLNQSFQWPGDIQWDGKYMTFGDGDLFIIYRFRMSSGRGTLVGTTSLGNADAGNWWINGSKVIAASGPGGSWPNQIIYWDYPAGGNPVKFNNKGIDNADGVTVSRAKH